MKNREMFAHAPTRRRPDHHEHKPSEPANPLTPGIPKEEKTNEQTRLHLRATGRANETIYGLRQIPRHSYFISIIRGSLQKRRLQAGCDRSSSCHLFAYSHMT